MPSYVKRLLVILPLWACSFSALSQQKNPNFIRITTEQGLSNNSVYAIHKDKKGFMWFGTLDGLVKYDGIRYTIYKPNPTDSTSISNNIIRKIFEDKQGNLWLGTAGGGLNKFIPSKNEFKKYIHKLENAYSISNNRVRDIQEDKQGNLWVATDYGLNYFNITESKFHHFIPSEIDDDISATVFWSVYLDDKQNVWAGLLDGGLFKINYKNGFDKLTYTLYQNELENKHSISDNWVWDINSDANGNLLLSTNKGVNKFNVTSEQFELLSSQAIFDNEINTWFIQKDSKNQFWIGSNGGGTVNVDSDLLSPRLYKNVEYDLGSMSDNRVYSFYADNSQNIIWFGTLGKGVNKFAQKGELFEYFSKQSDFDDKFFKSKVTSISRLNNTKLWVGTEGSGVYLLDINNKQCELFNDIQLKSKEVESILFNPNDSTLWVGTKRGLNIYNLKELKEGFFNVENSALKRNRIISLMLDSKGKVWVGTLGGGVTVFEKGIDNKYSFSTLDIESGVLNDNIVWQVKEMYDGSYWIAGEKGISIYHPQKEQSNYLTQDTRSNKSLSNDFITFVHTDVRNNIWVGTLSGGLNLFNPSDSTFTVYNDENGLSSNMIFSALEDDDGNLWLSVGNGIVKFKNAILLPQNPEFESFTKSNFLKGDFFSRTASVKLSNSQFVFGGIDGVVLFNPKSFEESASITDLIFTGFQLFQDSENDSFQKNNSSYISYTDTITLEANQNFFTIEYALLSYIEPEKNLYTYKLENLESDWNKPTNKAFATYTNLDPGEYIFRVKAANYLGKWTNKESQLFIKIKYPWWNSIWAYIGYTFILLIVPTIIYIRKERKRVSYQKTLEQQVLERTQEIESQNNALQWHSDKLGIMNAELQRQNEEVLRQNENIHASLSYAQTIQQATLPNIDKIQKVFPKSFILFKPLDIVSGDIYWFADLSLLPHRAEPKVILAVIDCTGHGVPGALMSMRADVLLHEIIYLKGITEASKILEELHIAIRNSLNQTETGNTDGMDVGLCVFYKNAMNKINKVEFVGARNSMLYIKNGEINSLKGSRLGIGGTQENTNRTYSSSFLEIDTQTTIYLFSDGYADQFGGNRGKKFMHKRFKELLQNVSKKPLNIQKELLEEEFYAWMIEGGENQIDDVLVMGVQIDK